jgi:hypothetical protein
MKEHKEIMFSTLKPVCASRPSLKIPATEQFRGIEHNSVKQI